MAVTKDQYHMNMWPSRPTIGVMGSAQEALTEADPAHPAVVAESLGRAIVNQDCILITGETTALPEFVAQAVRGDFPRAFVRGPARALWRPAAGVSYR